MRNPVSAPSAPSASSQGPTPKVKRQATLHQLPKVVRKAPPPSFLLGAKRQTLNQKILNSELIALKRKAQTLGPLR